MSIGQFMPFFSPSSKKPPVVRIAGSTSNQSGTMSLPTRIDIRAKRFVVMYSAGRLGANARQTVNGVVRNNLINDTGDHNAVVSLSEIGVSDTSVTFSGLDANSSSVFYVVDADEEPIVYGNNMMSMSAVSNFGIPSVAGDFVMWSASGSNASMTFSGLPTVIVSGGANVRRGLGAGIVTGAASITSNGGTMFGRAYAIISAPISQA